MSNKLANLKPVYKEVEASSFVLDPTLNLGRFKEGMCNGVMVKDNYDLDSMMIQIYEARRIHTPIHAYKDADGNIVPFQGNRRANAAQKLVELGVAKMTEQFGSAEAATDTLANLKKIPTYVYTGLTREQVLDLINDQDQKSFSDSGLINICWGLQDIGKPYKEIAMSVFEQFANRSAAGRQKVADIAKLTTLKEKEAAVTKWLRGSLDDEILLANRLGNRVKKAFWIKALRGDQLTDESPEFPVSRDDIRALAKAKGEDGDLGWNPETGGATFNAAIQKLIDTEKNKAAGLDADGKPLEPKSTKPAKDVLKAMMDGLKSQSSRSAIMWTQGDSKATSALVKAEDAHAFRFEQVRKWYDARRTEIKNPEVADALKELFGGDYLQFETSMAKFI